MFILAKKKSLVVTMVTLLTFAMVFSPLFESSSVLAKDKKNNKGDQEIDQEQGNKQNAQCVSGEDVIASCNNLSFQDQDNDGNNAAAQDSGDGKKSKGNKGDQEIDQDQSSRQNSQCVAGGSIAASCNNLSFQDQDNDGNNAAAQDSGDGKKSKGNKGDQKIDQDQDNKQNAQCVSGEDAIVSCNNLQFQNQINSGNNALGQN